MALGPLYTYKEGVGTERGRVTGNRDR